MKRTFLVLLPFFIAFFGCSKPAGIDNAAPITVSGNAVQTCPDFYYFYNQEKVPLQVYPEIILVGFAAGQSFESKRNLLERFDDFAALKSEQQSAAGTFSIVKLKTGTTCQQTLALIKELQKLPEVTFANPAFKPPHTLSAGYSWIGLTSEFIVTLKSAAELSDFYREVEKTKTSIADTLGETTFLVQAPKTAQGNALEMANHFQQKPFVKTSEPDFYLAGAQY